jgi:hypothetical protein
MRTYGDRPISTEQLGALSTVFSELCMEQQIEPTSPEAEQIASLLIRLYQAGIHDETILTVMARMRVQNLQVRAVG